MRQNLLKKSVLIVTILLLLGATIDVTVSISQNNYLKEYSQKIGEYDYWIQTTDEDLMKEQNII